MSDLLAEDGVGTGELARIEGAELGRSIGESRRRRRRWGEILDEHKDPDPGDNGLVSEGGYERWKASLVAGADDKPAELVTWNDIDVLADASEEAADGLWRRMRREALEELDSGHRAARVVEPGVNDEAWERARFLAVRDALRSDWKPRGGMESLLIDQLAQIQTTYEAWFKRHVRCMGMTGRGTTPEQIARAERNGEYITIRVDDKEELDQTSAMVDRWQRDYLRTVRALRDLRRHSPVIVQNAGQVNIGEQQLNLSSNS